MAAGDGPEADEGGADEVVFPDGSPVSGVEGVVGVVSEGEVFAEEVGIDVAAAGVEEALAGAEADGGAGLADGDGEEGMVTLGELVGNLVFVGALGVHDHAEAFCGRRAAIDEEAAGVAVNAKLVAGDAGEALDVVGAGALGAVGAAVNPLDAAGVEDEDLAAVRTTEVVGDLVDEHEVAAVGVAGSEDGPGRERQSLGGNVGAELAAVGGHDAQLFTETHIAQDDVFRGMDGKLAVVEQEVGVGEEVPFLVLLDGGVEIGGAEGAGAIEGFMDVVPAAEDKVEGAAGEGGEMLLCDVLAGDAVEGGFHGTGGDAERLEVVGADAEGYDDGDEEDLDVFLEGVLAPVSGEGLFAGLSEGFFGVPGCFAVACLDGVEERRALVLDLVDFLLFEEIALVIEELAGALVKEPGLFLPAGSEHGRGGKRFRGGEASRGGGPGAIPGERRAYVARNTRIFDSRGDSGASATGGLRQGRSGLRLGAGGMNYFRQIASNRVLGPVPGEHAGGSSGSGPAERSDEELVRQSQDGGYGAFDELVTRHRGRVYAMIYNMVKNEADAWDLAQDVFLKAWKALPRFEARAQFATWLYRITHNVVYDWMRRRRVESAGELDDRLMDRERIAAGARAAPVRAARPDEAMERGELRARLASALDRLSPEHREAILLREVQGLDYKEIAEVMGCSMGTVMSRLYYARKKLQSMLSQDHESQS